MGAVYPDDDDGNTLNAVAAHGADMSKPMLIDRATEEGASDTSLERTREG